MIQGTFCLAKSEFIYLDQERRQNVAIYISTRTCTSNISHAWKIAIAREGMILSLVVIKFHFKYYLIFRSGVSTMSRHDTIDQFSFVVGVLESASQVEDPLMSPIFHTHDHQSCVCFSRSNF